MADLPCRLIARVHRTAVNDSDSQLNVAAALMQPVVRRELFPKLPPCFRLAAGFQTLHRILRNLNSTA